jgi:hypothetical protein
MRQCNVNPWKAALKMSGNVMKVTTLALSLALATALLLAQAPVRKSPSTGAPNQPNTDSTPPKKPGSVEGIITNSISHEPVKKANVSLRNVREGFSYAAITDAAGHFLFDNVEPGAYMVSADRDGFTAPQQPRTRFDSKPLTVDEEQHVKDAAAQLMPLGLVSGHVADEDGDPIAGASVQALRYFYNQGIKQLRPSGFANTNDLGEFQMINLEPARYYFQVTARTRSFLPPHTRGAPQEEAYPATYYPSGIDIAQATSQEVTAGGHLSSIDFRLHKAPAYHLRGKVVDGQTGQPARNTNVRLVPRDGVNFGANSLFGQVQQDGAFDIGSVVNGSYSAIAQRADGQGRTTARQVVNIASQDVGGVILTLSPGLEISGAISVEGTPANPPQNQQQNPQMNRQPRVSLQPIEQSSSGAQAIAESDGTFVLHGVSPEIYRVTVFFGQPGTYLKSIRLGDQDVPSGQIDLTQQGSAALNIVFGTDGGQIQGTVQDSGGKLAPGISITLAPREEYAGRRDLFKQTRSDQNGSFRFQDLAPGEYKVFAWEDTDMNIVQAAEFRKPFESKAASVSIGANSKESVQLNVITTSEIEAEKSKLP